MKGSSSGSESVLSNAGHTSLLILPNILQNYHCSKLRLGGVIRTTKSFKRNRHLLRSARSKAQASRPGSDDPRVDASLAVLTKVSSTKEGYPPVSTSPYDKTVVSRWSAFSCRLPGRKPTNARRTRQTQRPPASTGQRPNLFLFDVVLANWGERPKHAKLDVASGRAAEEGMVDNLG
ncbi:hypothetical protein RRG08_052425 [Elysia crispata]|uniref:Uncharacterized protein n=1 Tax=Elysia crispata TaxID=231223 RepID=A0AAE1B185_9GAST|nr:hypothetical protein RRG08_052425 [Elysia crispata]